MPEPPAPGVIPNRRFRRFFHAVASGYAQLIANTLYVLASVPLALHFLQKREFGLWALAMQLGGYLQLIDLGMSASVSRHLIDHKDKPETGEYGETIKTGGLVLGAQGLIVLVGGVLVILFGTRFLHIDPDLERPFKIVMFWQCTIIAADFPARLFAHLLIAHQRADVTNYSQIGLFFVSYAMLWFCLAHGFGIYSLVWANVAGWLIIALGNMIACSALRIFPTRGTWGRPTWSKFRELFRFGKDVFWIALGTQMITASQTIVVTRSLGLNAAAVWSVCTRPYTFANQLVWRPFDFSYPMLSEMVARGDKDRLLHRFKGLVILTTSLSIIGAVMFAFCNRPFVAIWTHGAIAWPMQNDALLSVWMILSALVHCHCGLPGITKQIGFMRYIYFIEGSIYVVTASLLAHRGGFAAVISASMLCTSLFSLPYGIWRTSDYFSIPSHEVIIRWLKPSIRLLLLLVPIGGAIFLASLRLNPAPRFLLQVLTIALLGMFLLLRVGVHQDLRHEISRRAPAPLRRLLAVALSPPLTGL
jgi:O-antigen/teichoic acid export membrane protein